MWNDSIATALYTLEKIYLKDGEAVWVEEKSESLGTIANIPLSTDQCGYGDTVMLKENLDGEVIVKKVIKSAGFLTSVFSSQPGMPLPTAFLEEIQRFVPYERINLGCGVVAYKRSDLPRLSKLARANNVRLVRRNSPRKILTERNH